MRIAIVDDEAAQRAALVGQIAQSLKGRELTGELSEYESGEDFLAAAKQSPFGLVFLDIYMQGMDGVETAKRFRQFEPGCPLVFTTTSTDHALDGYRVRALQYLVKPYDASEIAALFDELSRRLPPPEQFLEVKEGRQSVRLRQRDILWADNYQHQVHIHLADGKTVTARMTFGEFSSLLIQDRRFFVCGRGVLVNLAQAKDFDGRSFALPGAQIPVSRDLADRARAAFGEWLFHQREA